MNEDAKRLAEILGIPVSKVIDDIDEGMWDILILIDAPIELRRARAAARDGVSEEIAGRRMESQKLMNEVSKGMVIPDADVAILNDSTESILQEKLQKYVITKML